MSDEPIYRSGRLIAGRYRITSALSQGGMGAVYLAQQVSLGRDVALKVILERGSDPELLKRFDVEARAVCQLKHPNIITYHDYGRDEDGHPFLVMEFLAGYPGTKLISGDRKPTVAELVHVISQVCSALDEAHRKGIIHRDLKWSNVMICPQGRDQYFAKLIDFGIMKVATDGSSGDQRGMTRTGMLLGTPEYMSPEAICGMPIDGRADQYSLAIMLWEALEGRRPFDAPSHFELLRMQVQDPPPPFERGLDFLEENPGLALVLSRALEKHPDDRFDSILEFQRALTAAIEGESTPATAKARPAARGSATSPPASRAAQGLAPRPVTTRHQQEAAPRKRPMMWLITGAFVLSAALVALLVILLKSDDGPVAPEVVAAADTDPGGLSTPPDVVMAPDTALSGALPPGTDTAPATAAAADTASAQSRPAPDTILVDTAPIALVPDTVAADTGPAPDTTPEAPPTVAAVTPDPGKKVTKPPVAQNGAPGRLTIVTDPWSYVTVTGYPPEASPFVRELKPGRYTVTLRRPDAYRGGHTFTVTIKSGEPLHRSIRLDDVLGRVE